MPAGTVFTGIFIKKIPRSECIHVLLRRITLCTLIVTPTGADQVLNFHSLGNFALANWKASFILFFRKTEEKVVLAVITLHESEKLNAILVKNFLPQL